MTRGTQERETVIMGIPFGRRTNRETLMLLDRMIEERTGHTNIVVTANLDSTVRAMKDPFLKRIIYGAALVTPDGMPIVWAGRTMNPPLTERVAGSDFIPMLIEQSAKKGHSFFFLGGREGIGQLAARKCKEQYPDLKIAGVYSPPFGNAWEMDNDRIVEQINVSGADVLIIAFGAPKQEYWMSMNYAKLRVPVALGVGATVDFISGTVPRAPEWMKKLSAEWLFRLSLEPKRLVKRYATDLVYGLLPLLTQTLFNKLVQITSGREPDRQGTIENSEDRIDSPHGTLHAITVKVQNADEIQRVAANLDSYFHSNHDALILDLRQCPTLSSLMISGIVSIDKSVRRSARHTVLVTNWKGNLALRVAGLDDLLTVARTTEQAVKFLQSASPRTLGFQENGSSHLLRNVRLFGELTNDTSFLVREITSLLETDKRVVLDLSHLNIMDCGGLQKLIDVWSDVRGRNEIIHCITRNTSHIRMLGSPGLKTRVHIHPTYARAMAAFISPPHAQRAFAPVMETASV